MTDDIGPLVEAAEFAEGELIAVTKVGDLGKRWRVVRSRKTEDGSHFVLTLAHANQGSTPLRGKPFKRDPDTALNMRTGEGRELLIDAINLVTAEQFSALSFVSRHLSVGHARSEILLDMMESWEVIGPRSGSMAPLVLMNQHEGASVVAEIRKGAK